MKANLLIALSSGVLLASAAVGAAGEAPTAGASGGRGAFYLRGGYFVPSDSAFRDIYGSAPTYGVGVTRRVAGRWDGWLEVNRLSRHGKLTFTEERTDMSLLRVAAGARRRFGAGTLVPYGGAGLGFHYFQETNAIGRVGKGGLGALLKAGLLLRLEDDVALDLGLGYSFCRMNPAGASIQLGGLEAVLGAALVF